MTGWTTITTVGKDIPYDEVKKHFGEYFDVDDYVSIHDGIGCRFREWGTENGVYVYTNTVNGANWASFVRIAGYRDWNEDVELMRELLSDVGKKVVIIHANDTSDTGEARLYKNTDGEFGEIDRYVEKEDVDGRPVGEIAASYMHITHHVPAVSNIHRMTDYNGQDNVEEL